MIFRFLSSGESHGKCLNAIIEGVPAGVNIDVNFINNELAKRQVGYGRGARMLIEKDKRGKKYAVKLAYSNEMFCVPENLYIIGMMNTADRSLAIMDYALRRRFSFYSVEPAFETDKFINHLSEKGISKELANKIVERFKELNNYIANETQSNLGKGFCVGHSYFCSAPVGEQSEKDWYQCILRFEIDELLQEYWWDEPQKAQDWKNRLRID